MDFQVRGLTDNDYDDLLVHWWKDWGWIAPPKDFLPENGTGGIMVQKNGVDICAGFIYTTNSGVALTEFVISDKNYKESDRGDAIQFLIDCVIVMIQDMGYKYGHVILKNKSLVNKYKESGYIMSDENVTEMIWQ